MAVGKKITDLTASGSLKDTDLAIIHDGNGTKRSTLTQLSEYIGTKFSNPNLLINPDFKINQRGKTRYEVTGFDYTVDRWRVSSCTVSVSDNGLTIQNVGSIGSWITQKFGKELEGVFTLSVKVSSISGKIFLTNSDKRVAITSAGIYSTTLSGLSEFNMFLENGSSVTIEWAKLEKGSIATPFVAPDPANELAKCRRFAFLLDIDSLVCTLTENSCFIQNYTDIIMRTNPTVSVINGSSENIIVRESMNSIGTKNLGKPISFEGRSRGRIIRVAIQGSDKSFTTMTTHDGISLLLLDAEIY